MGKSWLEIVILLFKIRHLGTKSPLGDLVPKCHNRNHSQRITHQKSAPAKK